MTSGTYSDWAKYLNNPYTLIGFALVVVAGIAKMLINQKGNAKLKKIVVYFLLGLAFVVVIIGFVLSSREQQKPVPTQQEPSNPSQALTNPSKIGNQNFESNGNPTIVKHGKKPARGNQDKTIQSTLVNQNPAIIEEGYLKQSLGNNLKLYGVTTSGLFFIHESLIKQVPEIANEAIGYFIGDIEGWKEYIMIKKGSFFYYSNPSKDELRLPQTFCFRFGNEFIPERLKDSKELDFKDLVPNPYGSWNFRMNPQQYNPVY